MSDCQTVRLVDCQIVRLVKNFQMVRWPDHQIQKSYFSRQKDPKSFKSIILPIIFKKSLASQILRIPFLVDELTSVPQNFIVLGIVSNYRSSKVPIITAVFTFAVILANSDLGKNSSESESIFEFG